MNVQEAREKLRDLEDNFPGNSYDWSWVHRTAKNGGEAIDFLERRLAEECAVTDDSQVQREWKEEAQAELLRLQEQFAALRLVVAQQLTPLDIAATHIDIIRRKEDDYSVAERDNVAAIVESHIKEARLALFAAISNLRSEA